VPSAALVQRREEVIAKQKALADIFAAKPDRNFSADEVSEIQQKNAELQDLVAGNKDRNVIGLETLEEIDGIGDDLVKSTKPVKGPVFPGQEHDEKNDSGRGAPPPSVKSFGEVFTESDAFLKYEKGAKKGPAVEIDLTEIGGKAAARMGIKALLESVTTFPVESTRIPTLITPGEQTPTVADLFPQGRTTQNSIVYMEETTTTNAAAETAEGGAKPEAGLAFTEKSSPVRKIAVWLPVTDELMEDAPAMEDYVNGRLRTFVLQREATQLLVGNGTAPNLRGILNTAGILTQAKGADPTPDAFYKAMIKVQVQSFLAPTGAVVHPNDWQEIRLLRTADGIYIWGAPSDPGPDRIWGINVVKTTAITENTGLVGAFRDGAQIFRRSDISLSVSNSHDDYFIKNQLAIRAEERLALVVFRPKAFCTVTGI
jgi:HK97 family phage major capsid protein